MADRTSAALFSELFEDLAKSEAPDLAMVKKLWKKTQGYDFHPCQMGCDKALMKLGLAKKHSDANGEEYLVYANGDASGWEEE